ncbi:hypothetical protein [uncultured Chryseobacterium sp.]|uniref:hypothetical protein n=1 Tax=uncultured Chryseobacterium sp. TaxID=259322 RepID=UPI0025DFB4C9|nr:hypothetical protein [uncultured Chryseobacterium sp.]
MKKIYFLFLILVFGTGFAQQAKKEVRTKDKFESRQPQDLSVPPPPTIAFPAQYPGGNKTFISNVSKNLDKSTLKTLGKDLKTKIILKIGADGKVLNVSTYGSNETFNSEVKKAAEKVTAGTQWDPGKNNKGEKVIDIVNLPFANSNK